MGSIESSSPFLLSKYITLQKAVSLVMKRRVTTRETAFCFYSYLGYDIILIFLIYCSCHS